MQRKVAVLLPQRGDPALELLLARGAEREADLAIEHRRVPAGLQLRLVLACKDAVDARKDARAVRGAVELLVVGVLDV